jgi:hypothetical protein
MQTEAKTRDRASTEILVLQFPQASDAASLRAADLWEVRAGIAGRIGAGGRARYIRIVGANIGSE